MTPHHQAHESGAVSHLQRRGRPDLVGLSPRRSMVKSEPVPEGVTAGASKGPSWLGARSAIGP